MHPAEDDEPAGRMYLLVIVCEVIVVTGLWLLGRAFA
jgi:hypothetical protein